MYMKKFILLAALCISLVANAQVDYSSTKSMVVIESDSVQNLQMADFGNRIQQFYTKNRVSQALILAGSIVGIAGSFLYTPTDGSINPFPAVGGAIGLVGGVVYLDSFKYLNLKNTKKRKLKKAIDDFY